EGLDFALVDRNGKDIHYQDVGGLDYSFQLERKVSELLLTLKAQRMGIKVFYGVSVDGQTSDITGSSSTNSLKTINFKIGPSFKTKNINNNNTTNISKPTTNHTFQAKNFLKFGNANTTASISDNNNNINPVIDWGDPYQNGGIPMSVTDSFGKLTGAARRITAMTSTTTTATSTTTVSSLPRNSTGSSGASGGGGVARTRAASGVGANWRPLSIDGGVSVAADDGVNANGNGGKVSKRFETPEPFGYTSGNSVVDRFATPQPNAYVSGNSMLSENGGVGVESCEIEVGSGDEKSGETSSPKKDLFRKKLNQLATKLFGGLKKPKQDPHDEQSRSKVPRHQRTRSALVTSPTSPTTPMSFHGKSTNQVRSPFLMTRSISSSPLLHPHQQQPHPALPAHNQQQQQQPQPQIRAKIVTDGTGLAKILTRKESQTECFDGLNFSSYWAYFKEDMSKEENNVRDWEYPATSHLCFGEGWSWWIRLISWEQSPRANLMDLITYLLDLHDANTSTKNLPTIQQLSTMFQSPFTYIVSIGFVIRDDTINNFKMAPYTDSKTASESERMFWAIVHQYPVIEKVLKDSTRYELLVKYYGNYLGTYFSRRHMSFRQNIVCGEGWFSVGNCVGFTSPLISPGINCLALGMAWMAGRLTVRKLMGLDGDGNGGDVKRVYEEYVEGILEGLRNSDLMLYESFKDWRVFMTVWPVWFANAIGDVSQTYTDTFQDSTVNWALGSTTPHFQSWSQKLLPLISGPVLPNPYLPQDKLNTVVALCDHYRDIIVKELGSVTKFSKYLRGYDDFLRFCQAKEARVSGEWGAVRCSRVGCRHANVSFGGRVSVGRCVACGEMLLDRGF
ncbi:hypothetical protein HDU76_004740, partial [Blyttiomyces sp. JEL0837]